MSHKRFVPRLFVCTWLDEQSRDTMATNAPTTATTTMAAPGAGLRTSSAKAFLEIINPLAMLKDAATLTPSEFLRDFYTRRGLHDKLKDVDALVANYGHQMPLLYTELDKKCV